MWLTSIAIRRPLIVLIAIGALIAFGLVSYTRLGVELLPALDAPIVTVTTPYPGAGPDAVDVLVTRKIEDAVASLNEIDTIQSTSSEGVSTVIVTFTERATKTIAQDVERRVNSVRSELPTDAKIPIVEKFDPNAQPIMQLSLGTTRGSSTGSEQVLAKLQRLAEDNLKKDLEAVSGVARVTVIGGLEREIQVQVDQQKLQAHGISILQVTQALAADNLNVPAGSVTQRNQDWTIRLTSQAQTLADLQSIVVATSPTGSVRMREVAVVVDTYKKVSAIQRTGGLASVGVLVYKQAGANTVATADAVTRQLALREANFRRT
jgi:hydrophobic/amphiphilic exporter-1 (mainly G- bacteria), HAE1 family